MTYYLKLWVDPGDEGNHMPTSLQRQNLYRIQNTTMEFSYLGVLIDGNMCY